jgi:hypothetical protein
MKDGRKSALTGDPRAFCHLNRCLILVLKNEEEYERQTKAQEIHSSQDRGVYAVFPILPIRPKAQKAKQSLDKLMTK